MGTVRILLALAVLNSHLALVKIIDGGVAVELFYLISGFLISRILRTAPAYTDLGDFISIRALRISRFITACARLLCLPA